MELPGEQAMRAERAALLATLESLTDEEFESGTTLCTEWAPRDIAAHLLGIDYSLLEYPKARGNINKANAEIIRKGRAMPRERLLHRMRHWAEKPAPLARATAFYFLGDLAIHHQDILRGLGSTRDVPDASADAIVREGVMLSMVAGPRRLLSFRIVPTDGGRPLGRGPSVRGTREALGMWLAGRDVVQSELDFEGGAPPPRDPAADTDADAEADAASV